MSRRIIKLIAGAGGHTSPIRRFHRTWKTDSSLIKDIQVKPAPLVTEDVQKHIGKGLLLWATEVKKSGISTTWEGRFSTFSASLERCIAFWGLWSVCKLEGNNQMCRRNLEEDTMNFFKFFFFFFMEFSLLAIVT